MQCRAGALETQQNKTSEGDTALHHEMKCATVNNEWTAAEDGDFQSRFESISSHFFSLIDRHLCFMHLFAASASHCMKQLAWKKKNNNKIIEDFANPMSKQLDFAS